MFLPGFLSLMILHKLTDDDVVADHDHEVSAGSDSLISSVLSTAASALPQ